VLLAATAVGTIWLHSHVIGPGRARDSALQSGSGVIIGSEATAVWLPESLIELARERRDSLRALTYEELRTALQRRGQQDLWYVLTLRVHQADQGVTEISYIRRPYRDIDDFGELVEILVMAAGNESQSRPERFADLQIQVLSREQSQRAPREVVEELLRQQAPSSRSSRRLISAPQ
jgi:hypothetical protein